jgi:hypothetical protein
VKAEVVPALCRECKVESAVFARRAGSKKMEEGEKKARYKKETGRRTKEV